MNPVAALSDLADGADVAVIRGSNRTKWKWVDGQLIDPNGDPLPAWFFSGLLAEGNVHLADFRPPEVGEWFKLNGRDNQHYLALTLENENRNAWFGFFRSGVFQDSAEMSRIVDVSTRERPPWLTHEMHPLLLQMTTLAHTQKQQLQSWRENRYELERLSNELNSIQNYATSAVNRVTRLREARQ